MRFSTFFVLASAFVCGLAQTTASVEADIVYITEEFTELNTMLTTFGTQGIPSLTDFLAIHGRTQVIIASIQRATDSAKGTPHPFTEADGQAVLDAATGWNPLITSFDTLIKSKKVVVARLAPFPLNQVFNPKNIVGTDITALYNSMAAFAKVLISAAPADLNTPTTALFVKIETRLKDAMNFYQS